MKLIFILSLLLFTSVLCRSQHPFVISLEQPELDLIADGCQIGNRFYFIQNRAFNPLPPFDYESFSDILITSEEGKILKIITLDTSQAFYHRILKTEGENIYLVGHLKSTICKSRIVISIFNSTTYSLDHISYTDFCENEIQKIKLVPGLANSVFIEEYHSVGDNLSKNIYLIDNNYNLILVKDSIIYSNCFSVDFSRKGYLVSADRLKRFYDANFNFRKQKWFNEDVDSGNETHIPFGDNLILLETLQPRSDRPNFGFQLMLIDSLLNIKQRTIILPSHEYTSGILSPFYGGAEVKNENEIWAGGNFFRAVPIDSGFFYIAKLDSNLNIQCQQFYGYDSRYRMYGLRALESGGAIIFGTRIRPGYETEEWLDIFAMRVGQNCELPTTSTDEGTNMAILSISVYPNPGINNLTFSMNGFDPSALRVELFDELGKVLFSQKDLTYSIQVPDLPAGQYFYRIFEKERLLGIGAWVKQ